MQDSQATRLVSRPKTKFDLIEKVGSKGRYQFTLLIIFAGVWACTGMALLGTPFYFLNDSFKCTELGLLVQNCQEVVCSLPRQQWSKYIIHTADDIDSITTDFGPYLCDDSIYVDLASTSVYVGALIGYIVFSFYSDNHGRRVTLILAWSFATAGNLLILFSQNLVMVAIGLFMLGSGGGSAVNMCFNFLGEVVEDKTRQRYSVILQPWFALGACLVTTFFIFINSWKFVVLILLVIPSIILLIAIFIYVEETPQFLLRKNIETTLKALNRIGKINKGLKNILVEEDIINVINEQVEDKQFQQMITPLDLCRFSSLRLTTICLCIISFAVYALYYGPVLVVDRIGFNIYVSSYVVQFSELIVYAPLYMVVNNLPRQKAGITLFSITSLCASLLLFITKPPGCQYCGQAIFQLIVVAIFRASSALYFIIMYIYMVELFPTRSRAMGSGMSSTAGTVASSMSPLLLGVFERNRINANIFFSVLALLSIGLVTLLPETLGKPLREQIYEIEIAKNKVRQSGYMAYESKIGRSQYKSKYTSEYKSELKSELLEPIQAKK